MSKEKINVENNWKENGKKNVIALNPNPNELANDFDKVYEWEVPCGIVDA